MNNEEITKLNLYQKINAVMKDSNGYIKKEGKIGYGNNTYTAVLHDDVTKKIQPLFVKYNLVSVPSMTETKIDRYQVTTRNGVAERYECQTTALLKVVNADNPSESLEITSTAHSFDTQDKSTGKAYSMAIKYCYLKLLMIASGDQEEERIAQENFQRDEKQILVDELIDLLKSQNKFNEKYRANINGLSVDMLKEKIANNK